MADIWAKRVEGWRRSGLSSVAFAEGKGFTGGGLRHMAYRLRLAAAKSKKAKPTVVQLARVVRSPAPAAGVGAAVVVVVGTARVEVRPGASREVLATVFEALAERGRG